MSDKTRWILVKASEKEIQAMEDAFYAKRDEEWWKEHEDALHDIWYKISSEFDEEEYNHAENLVKVLKEIEQQTSARPPRVYIEDLTLRERWFRVWALLEGCLT